MPTFLSVAEAGDLADLGAAVAGSDQQTLSPRALPAGRSGARGVASIDARLDLAQNFLYRYTYLTLGTNLYRI
jgi:hypothetical protein